MRMIVEWSRTEVIGCPRSSYVDILRRLSCLGPSDVREGKMQDLWRLLQADGRLHLASRFSP